MSLASLQTLFSFTNAFQLYKRFSALQTLFSFTNKMIVNGNNGATECDLSYMVHERASDYPGGPDAFYAWLLQIASMQSCTTCDGKHSALLCPKEVCMICGDHGHWDFICMNDQMRLGSPKMSATPESTPTEDPVLADLDAHLEAMCLSEDFELARQGIAVVYPYRTETKIEKPKKPYVGWYSYPVSCMHYYAQSDNHDFVIEVARCDPPKSSPKKSPGWWKNLRVVVE